jgi:glycosyltransferase involved in cell wall biosynthesis
VVRLGTIARGSGADIVYLNSLFSRMSNRYLVARRAGLAPPVSLIIAPHGECSRGALGIRGTRKRLFLRAGSAVGLHRGARWQASTDQEREDIARALPWLAPSSIMVVPDVAGEPRVAPSHRPPKTRGRARLVFISRLARMKNLHFALRALASVRGEVTLDVFGTADDEGYLLECQAESRHLPPEVSLRFLGPLAPDRVVETFAAYEFSLLPTLGENFGHVIFESLGARCPVVLSDRTGWPDLGRAGAGFTVPIDDPSRWTAAIQACVDMGPEVHADMADRAQDLAQRFVAGLGAVQRNLEMFERCARPA